MQLRDLCQLKGAGLSFLLALVSVKTRGGVKESSPGVSCSGAGLDPASDGVRVKIEKNLRLKPQNHQVMWS